MASDPVNSKNVAYAVIPPFPLTADSVSVLASGTDRQRAALDCIKRNNFFHHIAEFRGVLASTIALGIDTPKSDLDFLCEAQDLNYFADKIQRHFSTHRDFRSVATPSPLQSRCYSFLCDDFEIEIFGSTTHLEQQFGFRHHVVMARLINLGGDIFREKLRDLKLAGKKSEPAIADILGLIGDPYESVAELNDLSDGELVRLMRDGLQRKVVTGRIALEG
jgi:hypothetical protein